MLQFEKNSLLVVNLYMHCLISHMTQATHATRVHVLTYVLL